jgi:two-component system response regulator RpfG
MPTLLILDQDAQRASYITDLIHSIDQHLNVEVFQKAEAGLAWLYWHSADMIIADAQLQDIDDHVLIQRVRDLPTGGELPLLMLTARDDHPGRQRVLEAGATDFLAKPVDRHECLARCRNLLTQRSQAKIIQERARWLEKRVADATAEIRVREHETLLRLAKAGEYRDEETGNHIIRMAKYSRLIAEALGLAPEECDCIELAAPMHDIGKIGVPDQILLKPGRLSAEEMDIMKTHSQIGYEILKDSPSEYLQMGAVIALHHHEKYNGTGYPHGLAGEEIPLPARIVAIADAYDALTSERPYKSVWSSQQAVHYLNAQKGMHFDPRCLDAFNTRLDRITRIQHMLADQPAEHRQHGSF